MCAIFGLIDYNHALNAKQRGKILRVLSEKCEERGTDATGYAFNTRGRLTIFKRPFAAHLTHLRLHEDANVIMGHTRMATQGNKLDNRNNHPFPGRAGNTNFALAHNGVLHNDDRLRIERKLPATPIKTDSYIAVQLLENENTLDMNSLANMAEAVEGSFVFTVLDERNHLYFVKGDNPLALCHYEKYGFYVYASTNMILDRALMRLGILGFEHEEISTECGDIVMIDNRGEITRSNFDSSRLNFWDYHYFMQYDWRDYDVKQSNDLGAVKQLKEFAESIGVASQDIDLLLDYGYLVEEIEELLYHPGAFDEAVCELLGEYEYCMEDF